jgi:hypothetical protein
MKYYLAILFLGIIQINAQVLPAIGDTISGESSGDKSGTSVSLSSNGDILAIGAPLNDGNGSNSGHVRVYKDSVGIWTQIGSDIDGETSGDEFGRAISMSNNGSILAVGAPLNDGNGTNSGSVRVYKDSSGVWIQIGQDIDGESSGDEFGSSVSLSSDGSILAIGAPLNDGNGNSSGHVRVFKDLSGVWTQVGSDINGENSYDYSGWSVSLSDSGDIKLAIGAIYNDGNGNASGHVRVYKESSGIWTQVGSDIDGEAVLDRSGWAVSLSPNGNHLAVGAPTNDGSAYYGPDEGHVRVYHFTNNNWTQVGSDIDGAYANNKCGYSVSISNDGEMVAVGSPENYNASGGNKSGHLRLFKLTSGSWSQFGNAIEGVHEHEYLGTSVALSKNSSRVAIGAPKKNTSAFNGYVTVISTTPCSFSNLLRPVDSICTYGTTWVKINRTTLDSVYWNVGIANQDSVLLSPGYYSVYYKNQLGCDTTMYFTVHVSNTPPNVMLAPIDTICPHSFSTVNVLSNDVLDSIVWNTGQSQGSPSSILPPGTQYWVYCKNENGCDTTIYFSVYAENTPPLLQLSFDDSICSNSFTTARITSNQLLDSISWSIPNAGNSDSAIVLPGSHWVYCRNSAGCDTLISFVVNAYDSINIDVEPCYIYCDLDSGLNRIVRQIPQSTKRLHEWRLLEDVFGIWTVVSTKAINDTTPWFHINSNPFNKSYRYKVQVIDSCGITKTQQTPIKTILLQSSTGTNGEVNLNWNSYEGANIWYYVIYRKHLNGFVKIDSVGSSITSYVDNSAPFGNLSYFISAVRVNACAGVINKNNQPSAYSFSSNTINESLIGIEENQSDIRITPNPTDGIIQVRVPDNTGFIIYNQLGQIVVKGQTNGEIDITRLPAGSYQLVITRGRENLIQTLMKL